MADKVEIYCQFRASDHSFLRFRDSNLVWRYIKEWHCSVRPILVFLTLFPIFSFLVFLTGYEPSVATIALLTANGGNLKKVCHLYLKSVRHCGNEHLSKI